MTHIREYKMATVHSASYIVYTESMRKIAIVTGASSGLGEEFALQIAVHSDADTLWLIARREDRLAATAEKIAALKRKCPLPVVIAFDVAGRTGVQKFARLLEEEKARGDFVIDMLVNNAGFGTYGPFADTSLERELDMIDINCATLTGLCGHALPYMTRGSTIINVASLAAFMPLGNFAVYAATKAYVLNFTIAFAAEVKERGIHVCALCPGSVSTEFAKVASNGARNEVLHGLPADKVVAHCLRRAQKKKSIAIMAFTWKLAAFASRFVNRAFIARFTYRFHKRPYRNEGKNTTN